MSDRNERLVALESVVDRWWDATLEAGKALCAIQDEELYKATHERYEDYVRDRFAKTRQWAYDLANWYRVNMLAGTEQNPISMGAARPLKSLRSKPDRVKKVVAEATKIAKHEKRETPTAKDVQAAMRKVLPHKPAQPQASYMVSLQGKDLNLIRQDVAKLGTIITDDDKESLDLVTTDLQGVVNLLVKAAVKHGHLSISLGIERKQPESQAVA